MNNFSTKRAGLAAARARARQGGRKFALTKAQVHLAQAAMAQPNTSVSELCKELGIERVTLYRYVGPKVNSEIMAGGLWGRREASDFPRTRQLGCTQFIQFPRGNLHPLSFG